MLLLYTVTLFRLFHASFEAAPPISILISPVNLLYIPGLAPTFTQNPLNMFYVLRQCNLFLLWRNSLCSWKFLCVSIGLQSMVVETEPKA